MITLGSPCQFQQDRSLLKKFSVVVWASLSTSCAKVQLFKKLNYFSRFFFFPPFFLISAQLTQSSSIWVLTGFLLIYRNSRDLYQLCTTVHTLKNGGSFYKCFFLLLLLLFFVSMVEFSKCSCQLNATCDTAFLQPPDFLVLKEFQILAQIQSQIRNRMLISSLFPQVKNDQTAAIFFFFLITWWRVCARCDAKSGSELNPFRWAQSDKTVRGSHKWQRSLPHVTDIYQSHGPFSSFIRTPQHRGAGASHVVWKSTIASLSLFLSLFLALSPSLSLWLLANSIAEPTQRRNAIDKAAGVYERCARKGWRLRFTCKGGGTSVGSQTCQSNDSGEASPSYFGWRRGSRNWPEIGSDRLVL